MSLNAEIEEDRPELPGEKEARPVANTDNTDNTDLLIGDNFGKLQEVSLPEDNIDVKHLKCKF